MWIVLGTVVSGVFVFICNEYVREIFIAQLQVYKKLKGKIAFALVQYAREYHNPIDPYIRVNADAQTQNVILEQINASSEFRQLSAELIGFAETMFSFHPGIPRIDVMKRVADLLIGLSNSLWTGYGESRMDNTNAMDLVQENIKMVEEIRYVLRFNTKTWKT